MKRAVNVKPKKNVRTQVLGSALSAAVTSKLCYFLLLCVTCTAYGVLADKIVVLMGPVIFAAIFFKSLIFEALLINHTMEASIGMFDWYSCVDDNLYLGAIPLQHQDLDRLEQLGIKAIVSIVQRFELETSTLSGKAVTPEQWRERGVAQLILDSPDFFPPTFDKLDAGADFLNKHLTAGTKCYCHCKSGKGRSASIVMAYFLKYKGEDVHTALAKMRINRPVVFGPNSNQMKNMIAYAEYLKSPAKSSR
uniref:Uncharacterized protein n=1 Tax=Spumella elongata TaxID=89044 RepID=A0A7S3GZG3_9STRA|mmetsp:Transcript_27023/g.46296  ORF Transcript_27023/g.46296 Transcript_27023/m.46296 type:complete len:250 (+) Transcript_27023:3-752(+)|eukprot:CAMPEP_0184974610 /NCGR_PEP_ID=MMETSP1098-20130426/6063_1 /TAXON_ID=89044 /ORGANISM="Spumella elongata, Strain CCAP 955/1" /LENGTH=249 /DNA_ID=CAMNT_0027497223 /DNA_START=3 /DNA_END=752 /DNA_ORIENTATION=-